MCTRERLPDPGGAEFARDKLASLVLARSPWSLKWVGFRTG